MRYFYELLETAPVVVAVTCGLSVLVAATVVVVSSTLRGSGIL